MAEVSTVEFPIYRKYENEKSYFKVLSHSQFMELKSESKGFRKYKFEATILPDRVLIQDMISNKNNHWVSISKEEFELILAKTIG